MSGSHSQIKYLECFNVVKCAATNHLHCFPEWPSPDQRREDREWWPVLLCWHLYGGWSHQVSLLVFLQAGDSWIKTLIYSCVQSYNRPTCLTSLSFYYNTDIKNKGVIVKIWKNKNMELDNLTSGSKFSGWSGAFGRITWSSSLDRVYPVVMEMKKRYEDFSFHVGLINGPWGEMVLSPAVSKVRKKLVQWITSN